MSLNVARALAVGVMLFIQLMHSQFFNTIIMLYVLFQFR